MFEKSTQRKYQRNDCPICHPVQLQFRRTMSYGIWWRVSSFQSVFCYYVIISLFLSGIFCADLLLWAIRALIFGVVTSRALSCAKLRKDHHLRALLVDRIRYKINSHLCLRPAFHWGRHILFFRSGALKAFARRSASEKKLLVLSLKIPETAIGAYGPIGTLAHEPAVWASVSAHVNAIIPRETEISVSSPHMRTLIVAYNTRPANGGKNCQGKSEDSELCNTNPCSEWTDFRGEQCATIPLLFSTNESLFSMTWLPWEVNNRKFWIQNH